MKKQKRIYPDFYWAAKKFLRNFALWNDKSDKPSYEDGLYKKDNWKAYHKSFMMGFVPDGFHGYKHSERTAQQGEEEKRSFRDSPFTLHCFTLVQACNESGAQID